MDSLSFVLIFLTSVLVTISSLSTNTVLDIETFLINDSDLLKLTSTALKFFEFRRCTESKLAPVDECSKLGSIPREGMNVYVGFDRGSIPDETGGEESPTFAYALEKVRLSPNALYRRVAQGERREKVHAILPDSNNMKASGEHDLVLVIDPYAGFNFGHFLGVFYLDLDLEAQECGEKHQIYMADRVCVTVARKPRCPDLNQENKARFALGGGCYVDFLPTVHRSRHSGSRDALNLLECANLAGFGACPETQPVEENNEIDYISELGQPKIRTRCRLFQRCDRGILIGGGWNRLHSTYQSWDNMVKMESVLRANGFLRDNLKMFYGDGYEREERNEDVGKVSTRFHSLALKIELRKHLSKICGTKHCADTLFIYLNLPSTMEGDFLLWDADNNGIAEREEVYARDEFLSDIAKCEAQRLIIMADQNRVEALVGFFRKTNSHTHVAIFGAGSGNQFTRNGEYTNIWANHSHPMACLKHISNAASLLMKDSLPLIFDTSARSMMNLSLSGAPCGDSYSRELRPYYQGCQNLPTSIWFGSLSYGEKGESSEDEEPGPSVLGGKPPRDPSYDSNVSYIRRFS